MSGLKTLLIENQHGLDKLRSNFDTNNSDFNFSLQKFKEEIFSKQKSLESETFKLLSQKINVSDLSKILENKLDTEQAIKQLGIKTSQEDLLMIKKEIEKIRIDLSRKSNTSDLNSHIQSTELALEDVAKDMMLKCNIKDVCALLDMKANIDDTNKALSEVHKEIDLKLNFSDYSSHLTDYNRIIEALCAENCLGR